MHNCTFLFYLYDIQDIVDRLCREFILRENSITLYHLDLFSLIVAGYVYEKAKKIVKEYLISNNVTFEECCDVIHVDKSEDTYHPYGMMCNFSSVAEYFTHFQNMLVINTGILPRAGGINTTAAGFPLIEEYISNYLSI